MRRNPIGEVNPILLALLVLAGRLLGRLRPEPAREEPRGEADEAPGAARFWCPRTGLVAPFD